MVVSASISIPQIVPITRTCCTLRAVSHSGRRNLDASEKVGRRSGRRVRRPLSRPRLCGAILLRERICSGSAFPVCIGSGLSAAPSDFCVNLQVSSVTFGQGAIKRDQGKRKTARDGSVVGAHHVRSDGHCHCGSGTCGGCGRPTPPPPPWPTAHLSAPRRCVPWCENFCSGVWSASRKDLVQECTSTCPSRTRPVCSERESECRHLPLEQRAGAQRIAMPARHPLVFHRNEQRHQ